MRSVIFRISTGYVGSEIEEEFSLEALGIIESEYDSEEDVEKDIEAAYDEWVEDKVTMSWDFV